MRRSLKMLIPEYTDSTDTKAPPVAASSGEPAEAEAVEDTDPAPFPGEPLHQYCPSCITVRVHRSRARNFLERMRRNRSVERLFRCNSCGWRGWLIPLVNIEGVAPLEAPDFDHIDEAVLSPAVEPRRPFSPRDLQ